MYENECRSLCDERPREVSEMQLSAKARDLLTLLCEVECMTDRLNEVIFGGLMGDKKATPTPCCLHENIDIATDVARCIAKNLDKILQKL